VTGKITGNRQDTINGKVVTIYTQCEFHNGQPTKEIFISNEADGLYSYGNDSDTSNLIYSGMIAKYPSSVGEQWTCGYFVFYFSNGKFQTYISNGVLINPNDTFTTPLQKFNCISYQYRTQLEVLTEYYCPGIGYLGYYDVYDGKFFGKRMLIDYKLN
jgi:hypothetical protein